MMKYWYKLNYRSKLLVITIVIFLVIGITFFIRNKSIFVTSNDKIETPKNWPKDESGLWQVYYYKNDDGEKLIPYPPKWIVSQTLPIKFIPMDKNGDDDYIGLGGGNCATLHMLLCVGNEPLYTSSRNAKTMLVFDKMVKNIQDYKSIE